MVGPFPELAAQTDHQRIDSAIGDVLLLSLNVGYDLLPCIDAPRMRNQDVEEVEFAARQRQIHAGGALPCFGNNSR